MARPRIEGMDERIVASFLERGIFPNQREVISAALRALVREQKTKEALQRAEQLPYEDSTYLAQLEARTEPKNESVGNMDRSAAVRSKRA